MAVSVSKSGPPRNALVLRRRPVAECSSKSLMNGSASVITRFVASGHSLEKAGLRNRCHSGRLAGFLFSGFILELVLPVWQGLTLS